MDITLNNWCVHIDPVELDIPGLGRRPSGHARESRPLSPGEEEKHSKVPNQLTVGPYIAMRASLAVTRVRHFRPAVHRGTAEVSQQCKGDR